MITVTHINSLSSVKREGERQSLDFEEDWTRKKEEECTLTDFDEGPTKEQSQGNSQCLLTEAERAEALWEGEAEKENISMKENQKEKTSKWHR